MDSMLFETDLCLNSTGSKLLHIFVEIKSESFVTHISSLRTLLSAISFAYVLHNPCYGLVWRELVPLSSWQIKMQYTTESMLVYRK